MFVKAKSEVLSQLSAQELKVVGHLVRARSELNEIRFPVAHRECKECGISAFHPKDHWQANQAMEGAWTRLNRALAIFGAKHVVPNDFNEVNEQENE